MAQNTLLRNTATVDTGAGVFVSTATKQANIEFVPLTGTGFTGTVIIESSTAPSPGSSDWFTIATLVFSAHTSILDINLYLSDNPWIRARTSVSTLGSISVYLAF
jgi:hypothetical protein